LEETCGVSHIYPSSIDLLKGYPSTPGHTRKGFLSKRKKEAQPKIIRPKWLDHIQVSSGLLPRILSYEHTMFVECYSQYGAILPILSAFLDVLDKENPFL
jgi:hypothetical protein